MVAGLSRKKLVFSILGLSVLLVLFLSLGLRYYLITPAGKKGLEQVFLIRDGSSLKQVAGDLEDKGLIRRKELFLLWAKLAGHSRGIKAGEYRLNAGMSPLEVLRALSKGTIIAHQVTIPEGFTISQIGELLERKGLAEKEEFISFAKDPEAAGRYGIASPGLEGYLYPDTYRFGRGLSPMSVIHVMVDRFKDVFAPLTDRAKDLGLTMEDVVTLASIIEKETGRAEERSLIASVFLNRLKKGMRLESDPTVIYGLKDFNGNLKKRHLSQKTPYNTYVIKGLPAGPIANPGGEAIRAVLYPARTDYLYFVSKNDGTHYFSKTLDEHNRAVNIYQRKKGKRRGKTS